MQAADEYLKGVLNAAAKESGSVEIPDVMAAVQSGTAQEPTFPVRCLELRCMQVMQSHACYASSSESMATTCLKRGFTWCRISAAWHLHSRHILAVPLLLCSIDLNYIQDDCVSCSQARAS